MRLPHQITEDVCLFAGDAEGVISALGEACTTEEAAEIARLVAAGLPPVTSRNALAVMTGYNLGFLWSILDRSHRHYRVFEIPKGRAKRQIEAPKVGLKVIQKWLSVHFERKWAPHVIVHGFVKSRSHITAARVHLAAEWVVSVDIENFFPSTKLNEIRKALIRLGYRTDDSLEILCSLCCYQGRLSQGAPSSPVMSNIALHPVDEALFEIAQRYQSKLTRYADDVVLSGEGSVPEGLLEDVGHVFIGTSWALSERKRFSAQLPQRLKVHGLLVHRNELRLTKGYRNRIRAFRYLQAKGKIAVQDRPRIAGHLNYATQIESQTND